MPILLPTTVTSHSEQLDEPAEEHARELIAHHTRPDGTSNVLMRTAMSHIDLGLIRARHDLDEAVDHGLTAFSYDRKTEASLLSRANDLDQLLSDRYPTNAWPTSSTSATRTPRPVCAAKPTPTASRQQRMCAPVQPGHPSSCLSNDQQ